jgi:large subunit ribosomal protein L19
MAIKISSVNTKERADLGVRSGDSVRVFQKIQEKGKTRLQVYEGLVLARRHGSEAGATFTVRKVVDGIGVERIFPLYSPMIDKIEITRRAKVRRAKLNYIREKAAREIKRQMRSARAMSLSTESDIEAKDRAQKAAEEAERAVQEAEAKRQEEEAAQAAAAAAAQEKPAEASEEAVAQVSEAPAEETSSEAKPEQE